MFLAICVKEKRPSSFARRIAGRFFNKSLLLISIIFFMEILTMPYIDQSSVLLLTLAFLFALDIFTTFQAYRVLAIFNILLSAMGRRQNFYISIGFWYVAIRIRDIYLFAYPGLRTQLVVLFEDSAMKPCRGPIPLRYIRGHVRSLHREYNFTIRIMYGEVSIYDPSKKTWLVYRGVFPVIRL